MTAPILYELAHHEFLRQQLSAEFPDADDETLADTLEGLTELTEMIGHVTRSYLDDRAMGQALRARIEEMQTRLRRFDHAADAKRRILTTVMTRAEIPQLREADFTLSLRSMPPGLVLHDEAQVPRQFFTPQPPKLDRRAVLDALKTGRSIPGATLSSGGTSLTVRTK